MVPGDVGGAAIPQQEDRRMTILAPTEPVLDPKAMVAQAETALADIAAAREAVGRVIFGQESVVEQVLVAILAGGHALLVGVPGLAKTKLVETLGTVLGLDARRVQFTDRKSVV